jgi:hypothetical protein
MSTIREVLQGKNNVSRMIFSGAEKTSKPSKKNSLFVTRMGLFICSKMRRNISSIGTFSNSLPRARLPLVKNWGSGDIETSPVVMDA